MALAFRTVGPGFAAEASGVNLSEKLSDADILAIDRAMNEHAVLVFRGQSLSQDQQLAFTRRFGPLDIGLNMANKIGRLGRKEFADIANIDADGNILPPDDPKLMGLLANQLWHSDSSFKDPPAKYSMLYAEHIPPSGGDTEYADMRQAHDALPDELRALIEGRSAEHYAFHSRNWLGAGDAGRDVAALPAVTWPLVRTLPDTGRKTLFIGVHTRAIDGMSVPEARMLLLELLEFATQRQFVYRHKWQLGDLVIWDNRCTLHRGLRYDIRVKRELRRSTTEDTGVPLVDSPLGADSRV
jgi:alpha-ketoglutarate-dependent 2,4-dichlorophenoxyacetate dioxygenase